MKYSSQYRQCKGVKRLCKKKKEIRSYCKKAELYNNSIFQFSFLIGRHRIAFQTIHSNLFCDFSYRSLQAFSLNC